MATIGKTTTPSTPTFGYIASGTESQVFMPFTTTEGGLYTSVTFWAAGGSALVLHGVIWVSPSDNAIAFGPGVSTSGGSASGVGAVRWVTDTFASPVFIAANTTIFIGWQRDASSGTIYWAYNGNDHSPNAQWFTGFGSTGQNITGATQQSPAGAVAAYATYTPVAANVRRSGAWTAGETDERRSGVWTPSGENAARRSGVWTPAS